MENKPKVIIGLPVNGKMIAQTTASIAHAIIGAKGKVMNLVMHVSCDIVSSRTWIVNRAIEQKATHLLFVDSDMVFGHDVIDRMLAHKKEIVGVEYNRRRLPLEPTHKTLEGVEPSKTELYKGKYAGTGLMLIDLSIFETLGKPKTEGERPTPWFNFGRDSQGSLVMGEDAWFCNVARDAGFDTWIDPTIEVGHIGEHTF